MSFAHPPANLVGARVQEELLATKAPSPGDPLGVGYLDSSSIADDDATAAGAPVLVADGSIERVRALRAQFDAVPAHRFKAARAACNPYEGLGRGPFVNRSALKLANLDHALDLVRGAQEACRVQQARRAGQPRGQAGQDRPPWLCGQGSAGRETQCSGGREVDRWQPLEPGNL